MNEIQDQVLKWVEDVGRFSFGENWLEFARSINENAVARAEHSLQTLLDGESMVGRRFLDVGSGSGLFSLAARRLGAYVSSFDFDPNSVRCTAELRALYYKGDSNWVVNQGSVLDPSFVSTLGRFDIVYAWGVLHHTGNMWKALEHVISVVAPDGRLCLALYNDQGVTSHVWRCCKRTYNRLPAGMRFLVFWPAFVRLWGPTLLKDALRGKPMASWHAYGDERGMSPMIDVTDWVGGYPFEVATPQAVATFCGDRGLVLIKVVRRTGIGCNEFVFRKSATSHVNSGKQHQ
jgi:2-polyprenyl-6-hydroxyphenyl methylase/3-demethylubiquinone-9 3-methyltransferase